MLGLCNLQHSTLERHRYEINGKKTKRAHITMLMFDINEI
jgi:hypothetical protein